MYHDYHDPNKRDKHIFDKSPEFWDLVVKVLFLFGVSILLLALVLKWLGYFG